MVTRKVCALQHLCKDGSRSAAARVPSVMRPPKPPTITPPVRIKTTKRVSPTNAELSRLVERRRAQELGHELPLYTEEAAAYIGFHPKSVERMARLGEIPAHPVSGVRRKTWRFYRPELDSWLRARVISARYPCSPDGKDSGHSGH